MAPALARSGRGEAPGDRSAQAIHAPAVRGILRGSDGHAVREGRGLGRAGPNLRVPGVARCRWTASPSPRCASAGGSHPSPLCRGSLWYPGNTAPAPGAPPRDGGSDLERPPILEGLARGLEARMVVGSMAAGRALRHAQRSQKRGDGLGRDRSHLVAAVHPRISGRPSKRLIRMGLDHPQVEGVVPEEVGQDGLPTPPGGFPCARYACAVRVWKWRRQPALRVEPHPRSVRVPPDRVPPPRVVDLIKQPLDIARQHPAVPPAPLAGHRHRQRLRRRSSGAVAVGARREPRLLQRVLHRFHDRWRDAIHRGGDPEEAGAACRIRDRDRLDDIRFQTT